MRNHYRLPLLLLFFLFAGLVSVTSLPLASIAQLPTTASAVSGSFTFTAINFPGATFTRAIGLNDHGDIVGDYIVAGVRHGGWPTLFAFCKRGAAFR